MTADGEPNNRARDTSPPASCPKGASSPRKPITSPREMLCSITFWTERCETPYGMQGKSVSGLHKKLRDVWEEPNMEKEQDRSGTNTWKGGIRVKELWSHTNHADTWRVRPCPAPDQRFVLSSHWTTFPSPFLHERTLFSLPVCMEVCMPATGVRAGGLSVCLSVCGASH